MINQLRRINNGEAEAEQSLLLSPGASNDTDENSVLVETTNPMNLLGPDKIVDAALAESVSTELIDLVAHGRETDADDDASIAAVDAAMADLL